MPAFAGLLVAVGARAQSVGAPSRLRAPGGEISLELGASNFQASDYHAVLQIFDHDPPAWSFHATGRGLWAVRSWLLLGGRVGYLRAVAAPQPSAPAAAQDDVGFDLFDVGAAGRFVLTAQTSAVRVDLSFDAGVLLGAVTYRKVVQTAVTPRVGASMFLGYAAPAPGLLVGARVGYRIAPWDGAGGSAWDPVFSGFDLGIEAGGRL